MERPYRSKLHRPCDRCRRRRSACILPSSGSCHSCVTAGLVCRFDQPAVKKSRCAPASLRAEAARSLGSQTDDLSSVTVVSSPAREAVSPSGSTGANIITAVFETESEADTLAKALHDFNERSETASSDCMEINQAVTPSSSYPWSLARQPIQHVCSLDQLSGATAQLCGLSAEMDPWLLRHCRFDDFGMRRLHGSCIRNVGGVPVAGLVPVHFTVAEDTSTANGHSDDGQAELDRLISPSHAPLLVSLFLRFVYPVLPIVSKERLRDQLADHTLPPLLLAALCASALPFVVHDPRLFGAYGAGGDGLAGRLWTWVYQRVLVGMHAPKLAVLQAGLLYLQRPPPADSDAVDTTAVDTTARSAFLASTVALAMALGLQLESRPWGIPLWEKRLRRRLFWAVYLEDKWTNLLHGRPPLVHPEEWDIQDLDPTDFEEDDQVVVFPAGHASLGAGLGLGGNARLREPASDEILFPYFVGLTRLVEETHRAFYTLRASQKLSEDFRASLEAARPIKSSLQAWYAALPDNLRLHLGRDKGRHRRDTRHHHRRQGAAALHFCYLTLELFLYRAILRPLARSPPPPPIVEDDRGSSTTAAATAALGAHADGSGGTPPAAAWFLEGLRLDDDTLDQLPSVDIAPHDDAAAATAAEATLNGAERCAGILVHVIATLTPADFDVAWFPWTRVGFAAATHVMALLLVQAPSAAHAARAQELLVRWAACLQGQHKSHAGLMTLGVVRLHGLQREALDRVFMVSPAAREVLGRG